jgi:mono/diheme cytochrome c family protein
MWLRLEENVMMLRPLLPAPVILGAILLSGASLAGPVTALKSPKANIPASDLMFREGPGSEQINNNCLTCHSADHVLNQPSLSKAAWEEVVTKMIRAYKAPVNPDDAAKIIEYLARTKGKP